MPQYLEKELITRAVRLKVQAQAPLSAGSVDAATVSVVSVASATPAAAAPR